MSDPYKMLELERGADPRAIKTAYFRLMRLHPPEKSPEEFKRIRAAYDLLSSPERRAAYDAEQELHDEQGAEAQAVLRAARECMGQGEFARARDMLERLLAENPSIADAREILGFAFLRLDQAGPALQQFERLVEAHPKSAECRIHVAQTLRNLKKIPEATESARRALELEPTHAAAAILLGELLGASSRWDEAFALWEKAIASATSVVDALQLRLCFVKAHLERHDREATEAVFDGLAKELERRDDNDLRRFVADRLCALSAQMFATERALAGKVLLQAAGRFSPSPVFEAFLPAPIRLLLEDLPEASRSELAGRVGLAKRLPVFSRSNPWMSILGGAALLALWALALSAARDPEPWGGFELFWISFLAVPAGFLLARGVAGVRRRATGTRLAPLTFIHPLYLLTTGGDELVAWPLVLLHSVSLTDHRTSGGGYQATVAHLESA